MPTDQVPGDKSGTVPFLDVENGRIVQIPASELRAGAIQVQIEGSEGLVWVLAEDLQEGQLRHPPFEEDVREQIRRIQSVFAEHHPLSFEEWEDGFRRDAHPEREIGAWLHAARVLEEFTRDEPSAERRQDVFRCVITCLTAAPESVWSVLKLEALRRHEAQRVIDRFFGPDE